MLKKSLILAFVLLSVSFSQTIEEIVAKSLEKNYSFKALENGIAIAKVQIDLSTKWQNPILSFGATDIQFEDTIKRDKEPMQGHFVGISQVIPMGDKLEISKKIALNDFKVSKLQVAEKQLDFKSKIYEFAYNIKLIEERIFLLDELKNNTKKLEDFLKELYKYNKATQVQILNAQILYKELKLKQQQLQTNLKTTKLKLEQLTYEKIDSIEFDTKIKEINILKTIDNHPKILQILETQNKFENISSLEKEKKHSDIKVSLTYFQRESYNDYVNLSIAIPLAVRNSEELKSRQAKYKSQKIKNSLEDMRLKFKIQIETLQQTINDSLQTYKIIKNDILPKFLQLQKTLENYNSFSSFENIDTKALIKNQNEIIKYKLDAISEKQKYFTSLAKSYYFNEEF